jgi:hypothetical protein
LYAETRLTAEGAADRCDVRGPDAIGQVALLEDDRGYKDERLTGERPRELPMPIDLRNPQDANWLAEGRGEDPDEDNPGEADYSDNGVI